MSCLTSKARAFEKYKHIGKQTSTLKTFCERNISKMNIESELRLYDHVDFTKSVSVPNEGNSEQKRIEHNVQRKNKKWKNGAVSIIHSQHHCHSNSNHFLTKVGQAKNPAFTNTFQPNLDAFDLLFYAKHYDPSPIHHGPVSAAESFRKKNYLEKIKKMSHTDKRKYRADRDLRYLHKNSATETSIEMNGESDDESNLFCVHHLTGRCNQATCNRMHQMRIPRVFGVCKFYLTNTCTKGNSCHFMHSEFPCRYFYLDMNHPKVNDEQVCRFDHGGPLNEELTRYFKKHLEFWAKSVTKNKPEQFESTLNDFIGKYEAKQLKLEQKYKTNKIDAIITQNDTNDLTPESILTKKQFERLAEHGVSSLPDINKVSVETLTDCGLTIDQIYRLTVSTNDEFNEMESQHVEPIAFAETKHPISETIDMKNDSRGFTNEDSNGTNEEFPEETHQENAIDNGAVSKINDSASNCDKYKDLLGDLEMSDDSDDEINLVINEDS